MKLKVKKISWRMSWKGLLGTKKAKNILLQTRFGIHTLGMSYPIDVIVLDNTHHVVKLKTSLQPNRIFLWNPLYKNVLELRSGTIQRLKCKKGQVINLQTF